MSITSEWLPVVPAEVCRRCGAPIVRKHLVVGAEEDVRPQADTRCGGGCTPMELQRFDRANG